MRQVYEEDKRYLPPYRTEYILQNSNHFNSSRLNDNIISYSTLLRIILSNFINFVSENIFFSFQNKLSNVFFKYNSDFENADSLKLKISFKNIQKSKKAAHSINIKKILTLPSNEFVNTFLTTYQKRRILLNLHRSCYDQFITKYY